MLTQEAIIEALRAVKYPGYSRDIVSFGLVKNVAANQGAVSVLIQLSSSNPEHARQIKEDAERVIRALGDVKSIHVDVRFSAAATPQGTWANQNKVPGINRIVAVASG